MLVFDDWRNVPSETGHNDFEYEQDRNLGYFVLVTGLEVSTALVCHSLRWYVD